MTSQEVNALFGGGILALAFLFFYIMARFELSMNIKATLISASTFMAGFGLLMLIKSLFM